MSTTNEYTIGGWIQKFRNELNTIVDFTLVAAMSDGSSMTIFSDESILSKYHAELEAFKTFGDYNQREREFYAYNPRLLAYDLYGVPELWYLILYANELNSALEFNLNRVYFYKASVLTLLDSIRALEVVRKDENEQEMTNIRINGTVINNDVSARPL